MDRHAVLPLVNPHAAGMVAVLVGNHQGIDVADVSTMGGEALFGLTAADSGVEQEMNPVRLYVDAVPVAA